LQLGRHQELAANDSRLIGEPLAIPSLSAGLLASFVGHRQSSSASRFTAGASGFLNVSQSGDLPDLAEPSGQWLPSALQ